MAMAVDVSRLRETVEHLASFERRSASEGERRAAEWIRDRFEAEGVPARVEEEAAVGSMPLPLGLLSAAGVVAALGGRRLAPLGLLAAAGIVDDVSGGPQVFRRLLPHRTTYNVTGEAGDPGAAETLILVAHHDAAQGGLIYRPELQRLLAERFPGWYAKQNTSPQMLRLVAAGPALAAIPRLRKLGLAISAGSALAFADIATRTVVPGANDNLTAVAVLLELARLLREQPVEGVRVLLVSTGSEESFMEGMRGWVKRHGPSLDPARTRVVVLETLGSPELVLLEGEGMIWMRDYDTGVRELVAASAADAGVPLRRGLRLGFASDALSAMRAGLPVATLASCDEYKMPSNYHSQRDVPHNVDYETVAAGVAVAEAAIRRAASARG
jgi:acetylornithine deacetylase/succinyl-diaminopimelate desuccinylase-like protein